MFVNTYCWQDSNVGLLVWNYFNIIDYYMLVGFKNGIIVWNNFNIKYNVSHKLDSNL